MAAVRDNSVKDGSAFLDGAGRPSARVYVVGGLVLAQEVEGNHAELHAGPAAEEKHVIVVGRETHDGEHLGLGVLEHRLERLGPVRDLHDGQSLPGKVIKTLLRFLHHFQWKGRRPCVEVVYAL